MQWCNTHVVSCVVVSVKVGDRFHLESLAIGQTSTKAGGRWLAFGLLPFSGFHHESFVRLSFIA